MINENLHPEFNFDKDVIKDVINKYNNILIDIDNRIKELNKSRREVDQILASLKRIKFN